MEPGSTTEMRITVGETVPHPYAQYASLKAEVTLTAVMSVEYEQEAEALRVQALAELDKTMQALHKRADDKYNMGHPKRG